MFKSVRIQNFRQFKDLKLDGLAQINLITGKNNTGKTSLLEALFMLATPTLPSTILTIANLRGVQGVSVDGGYAWGYIYRDGKSDAAIVLEAHRMDGVSERLDVRVARGVEAPLVNDGGKNGALASPVVSTSVSEAPAIEYEYEVSAGPASRKGVSRLRVTDRGGVPEQAEGFTIRPWYFLGHGPVGVEDDAVRFSELISQRRKNDVVDALRLVEPRLVDLDVLALRPSVVAADLGSGPLVPATYLGQGFERLLAIILAVLRSAGGTLLIDEIEDGLHYSTLVDVWKVITQTALTHDVQIFATTHSYECLEAAVKGSEGHRDKLALFRLSRRDGDVRVTAVEDEGIRAAVDFAFELR